MIHSAANLRWTLRRSFVDYIARVPDGRMSVTDGADVDGVDFIFEHYETSGDEHSGTIRYRGDVRFAGHGNMLTVCIIDPVINYEDDRATVSIQLPESAQRSPERINLGVGSLEKLGGGQYKMYALQLTPDGSDVFAGVYSTGDPLDDMEFSIPA